MKIYNVQNYNPNFTAIKPKEIISKPLLDRFGLNIETMVGYKGEKTIVAGHTPVQTLQKKTGILRRTLKPLFFPNNVIMCDTGAYMDGGKLSCIDVLSKKVWLS